MKNLYAELTSLLSSNSKYVTEGVILKNKITELALNLDAELIKLLLKNESLKKYFFKQIDDILVFDKISFQKFVNNKQFLPDSYTQYKNKVGLLLDNEYLSDSGNLALVWPYKDCILEGGQDIEDAKRDEVFWSEVLAPEHVDRLLSKKTLVNFKRYRGDSNSIECEEVINSDNLVIKGNNLLVLHTLKDKYAKKVDLIYIDPPYNPDSKSNTFCYNNKFSRSTWLTFMKNRLDVAKEMLVDEGVLIVAIDENEQAHLGVLLKELFVEHEIHCITIVHNPRGVQGTNFSYTHEYAFFVFPKGKKVITSRKINSDDVDWSNFRNWGSESERSDAKNCFYPVIVENGEITGFGEVLNDDVHPQQTEEKDSKFFIYPIDVKGVERKWRYARQSVDEIKHLLKAKKSKSGGYEIEIGKDFGTYKTVWEDPRYDANIYGTKLIKTLVPDCAFAFPKSLWNVYDCISAVLSDKKEALVLDFFGGSGTTAHAVLELNKSDGGSRKFILAEQMHYVETVTVPRIHQVMKNEGKNSFIYCELATANQKYIDQIQGAENSEVLEKIWKEMQEKAFLSYRLDIKKINEYKSDYEQLSLLEKKQFLIETLDKNLLYVPYSEVDDVAYGVSEVDKKLNKSFFDAA